MVSKILISIVPFTLCLLLSSCSHSGHQKQAPEISQQSREIKVGEQYTVLIFEKNQSNLDASHKKNLKKVASRAHRAKLPVEKIRILAWGDQGYPDKAHGETSPEEISLASERAQNVKGYLEKKLKEDEEIDSYNMAKRPDLVSKLFRNDEFKVKEALESSGATDTEASRALVIIDYEGQTEI